MKTVLFLMFLAAVMLSEVEAATTIEVTPITLNQWSDIRNSSLNMEGGFSSMVRAGGNAANVTEFGISAPYLFSASNDIDPNSQTGGWWDWGNPYQFSLTNDGGGGYRVSMSASNVTPVYRPTTPYPGGLVLGAYVNFPAATLKVENISITKGDGSIVLLGNFNIDSSNQFEGFWIHNADGSALTDWMNLTAQVTFGSDLPGLYASSENVHFGIAGLSSSLAAPEPGRVGLLIVSLTFALFRRRRE